AQTPEALTGILITTTIIPVFLLVLAMIDINFYNLDEKKYKNVVRELENRDKVYLDHIDDFKA
ncbi:MFS transporter, partial [Bacillus spizizenii]